MPWTATFHYGLALCFYVAALRAKKSWRSLLLLAVCGCSNGIVADRSE
jgi:hypothetical protein